MKLRLIIAIALLGFIKVKAQLNDETILVVKYQFQFVADSLRANNKSSDLLELDIGKKISHCYSLFNKNKSNKILNDLRQNQPQNHTISIDYSRYSSLPNGISQEVFKNNSTGEIYVLDDIMTYKCYYIDDLNIFKWSIKPDTLSFLNYHCQKATANFRGRNYIAWFTTEIPFSNGPLKFGELPGLILKLTDDRNVLEFLCIEIIKPTLVSKIALSVKGYERHKRSDIKILKERASDDPVTFINSISPNNRINSVDANYKPGLNKKKPFSIEID